MKPSQIMYRAAELVARSIDAEKSQLANKIKALNMLKAKVWEKTDKFPSNDDEFKFQFD